MTLVYFFWWEITSVSNLFAKRNKVDLGFYNLVFVICIKFSPKTSDLLLKAKYIRLQSKAPADIRLKVKNIRSVAKTSTLYALFLRRTEALESSVNNSNKLYSLEKSKNRYSKNRIENFNFVFNSNKAANSNLKKLGRLFCSTRKEKIF